MIPTILVSSTFLFALWVLLSGHFSPFFIITGAISSIAVAALSWRLGVLFTKEHILGFSFRQIFYVPWLIGAIIKSNLDVARRVWSPTMPINPCVVWVKASQKTELGLAVHANCITLTPGTLSIDTAPGEIEVHALAPDIAEELLKGEFDRRIRALEGPA